MLEFKTYINKKCSSHRRSSFPPSFFFIFSPAREAFFGPDFGSSDSDPSKLLTSHSPLGSLCLRAHYEKCQTNNKTEDVRSAEAQGEEESLQRLLGWCCWFCCCCCESYNAAELQQDDESCVNAKVNSFYKAAGDFSSFNGNGYSVEAQPFLWYGRTYL